MSKYGVISGLYFPAFGLNTERYEVSLRIQSECGKIRTRNNSVFGHFSGSDTRHSILFHRNPEESKSGKINPISTNVSIMDKPGSRFLLPKCLKNACGRVIF